MSNAVTALEFKAQYIRANLLQYDPAPNFPETVLIKDRGELEKYYADNINKYNLRWDSPDCFYEAVLNGYDEDFFKERCLLFVVVQEGSGSISHVVKKVEYDQNSGTIGTVIDRIVPNTGTDDMAEWHIVIELDRSVSGSKLNIDIKDVYMNSDLSFKAQYIRTTYRGNGKTLLIKSSAELEKYISDNS